MPKPRFTEQFLVTVISDKPIADLVDIVAGRMWSLDHVVDCTASVVNVQPPAAQPINDADAQKISPTNVPVRAEEFTFKTTDEMFETARQAVERDAIKVETSWSGFVERVNVDGERAVVFEESTPVGQLDSAMMTGARESFAKVNSALREDNKAGHI